MDASACKKNKNLDNIYGFHVNSQNTSNPCANQKKSVTKYTRLPDFDFENKVSWSLQSSTEPRSRRIITVEEPLDRTTRSLKSNVAVAPKKMTSNISRKIVTIAEDNDADLHPKFSQDKRKVHTKNVNRSIGTDNSNSKHLTQRTTTRLSNSSKSSREIKSSAKSNVLNNKNDVNSSKLNYKNKYSTKQKLDTQINVLKKKNGKEDNIQVIETVNISPKISIRRKITSQSESAEGIYHINNKLLNHDLKKDYLKTKNTSNINQTGKSPSKSSKHMSTILKNIKEKKNPITIIHIPKDKNTNIHEEEGKKGDSVIGEIKSNKLNSTTEAEKKIIYKDVNVGTESLYTLVDHETETSDGLLTCNHYENILTYDRSNDLFDSLDIPNVSLTKDKNDLPKEEIVNFFSKSLPNIRVPSLNMISLKETQNEQIKKSLLCNNNSFIISRATVTYTSKQKIDFQVVENHEKNVQNHLRSSPLSYPISVVSVFKKELAKREYDKCTEYKETQNENGLHNISERRKDVTSVDCSLVAESDKLKKPSDIISTIKVNNSLLQNSSVCEQFERELNFIDSFFESLQYLETCSLSDKSFTENNVEHWINSGYNNLNLDCGSFLSKFENDICVDENETMASKSLCMLNLLIRHEQRRAKNLLFVLKMREDALKDYTKSQILWLENKKKQENTDIPTLKKKQRGALLKLQHECGEMQRMRKALLTLSEKRKIALMKTKKNLEWKLENNIDVEKIILGKRKIKRVLSSDRSIAPVKCFDLSSSGCDESTTSRAKSNTPVIVEYAPNKVSVEKCIQTGDSILEIINTDQSQNIANEHFVVVDGVYLNIIFRDLSLPQIFSGEKQYEVNEEAIKNILNSSNPLNPIVNNGDAIGKLMDQIKNHEVDSSSTPSTARSLVEEFDQYYRGLLDEDSINDTERLHNELEYDHVLTEDNFKPESDIIEDVDLYKVSDSYEEPVPELPMVVETEYALQVDAEQRLSASVSGPLPVPAGAAAVNDPPVIPAWVQDKTPVFGESSPTLNSSLPSLSSPTANEAEELRRQQLAIEREIKALEQQQSQFLVVREIPDKPPPPYTPPIETRPPKPPRSFSIDINTKERIKKYITEPDNSDSDLDAFKSFVKDFCHDSLERQKAEQSKVWDTCCVHPPKPQPDIDELVNLTAADMKEVLTCVTPTIVSGVGARRSDHIDDILFAEWRRCEPEWTSLHADEVIVKNQLLESIFEKVLTETIDEYKNIVLVDK